MNKIKRKLSIFDKYIIIENTCNENNEKNITSKYCVAITLDNDSLSSIEKYCTDNKISKDSLYLINFSKNNFKLYFNIMKYNDKKLGEVFNIIINDSNFKYYLMIGKDVDLINSNIIEIINYFNISNWILSLFDNNYQIFKDIILKVFKLKPKNRQTIYFCNWPNNYNKKCYDLSHFFYYPIKDTYDYSIQKHHYVFHTFISLNYIINNFDYEKWNDNRAKKINKTFSKIISKSNGKELNDSITDYLNSRNKKVYTKLKKDKAIIELSFIDYYIKKSYFLRFLTSFTDINIEELMSIILSMY